MNIVLVAALDEERCIGTGRGGLPWHLPAEAAHFRALTEGGWVLVGRVTFEEMEGWFGNRRPVVVTRGDGYQAHSGALVAGSVEEGIGLARRAGAATLFVAGGAGVYAAAMPLCDRMILSRVPGRYGGTVHFPEWPGDEWQLVESRPLEEKSGRQEGILVEDWRRTDRKM